MYFDYVVSCGVCVCRCRFWLCYLTVVTCSLQAHAGEIGSNLPTNPYACDSQLSCGPRCAAFLLDYLRRDVSYVEVLEECPPGPFGTSLEQVKNLLDKHGVYTLGFSGATTGKLKRLCYPAIMHVNSKKGTGHFLVLLGWEERKHAFRVYNAPSFYGYMTEEEIGDRLSGLGLAVSDRPLPSVESLVSDERPLWSSLIGLCFGIVLFMWAVLSCWPSCGSRLLGKTTAGKASVACGKNISAMCLTCLLSLLANPGCNNDNDTLTRARTSDRVVDLGRIIAGKPIQYTFRVLNSGARPFNIKHVRKSCSCETVIYDHDRVVKPGDYASLTIEAPTKGREGSQAYYFVLETDSTEDRWNKIPLVLKAQLAAKIKANPSQISFGTVSTNKGAKNRLVVVAAEGNVCNRFQGFELHQQVSTVLLTQRNDAPTGMIEMEVEIPRDAPIGDINATIVLKFEDNEVPRIEVPVVGRVEGDIHPVPQVLIMSSGNNTRRIVGLMSRNGRPFSIKDVHSDAAIRVEPVSAEQSITHRYAVFVVDGLRSGDYSITFTTDQPMQDTVTLPVIVHE